MSFYNWLVTAGLYRDVLAAVIGIGIGHVLAWLPVRRILRKHQQSQERIADLLDTDTPGGLHDIVHELKKREVKPQHQPPPPTRSPR